jgi:hypothetical protein
MITSLNLAECTPKFRTEKYHENPKTLQYFNIICVHSVLGQLATVHGLKIFRSTVRFKNTGDFLEVMDAESQKFYEFSVGLFDWHRNIRPWFVDSGAKSGSGCCGTELGVWGYVVYSQYVRVNR